MNKIKLLLIVLTIISCTSSNNSKMDENTRIVCGHTPFNWYEIDKQMAGTKDYVAKYHFGPKDKEFRQRIENLLKKKSTYNDVIKLTEEYLPTYFKTCTSFYTDPNRRCGVYLNDPNQLKICLGPIDEAYKERLGAFMELEMIKNNNVINFENMTEDSFNNAPIELINYYKKAN